MDVHDCPGFGIEMNTNPPSSSSHNARPYTEAEDSSTFHLAPRPKLKAALGFAALAKQLVMQERLIAAAMSPVEQSGSCEEEEQKENEFPLEELLEKAKTGDLQAQSNLGRYYLKLAEKEEKEVNNQKAVEWLIQAAKHGHRDAAKLLQTCWAQRKGITDQNEEEVGKLSSETKFEQAVRKAALLMYWKLNPDKKKAVAVSELLDNVKEVNIQTAGADTSIPTSVKKQRKVLESLVTKKSGKYVGLDDFVEITKKYAEGLSPTAGTSSCKDDRQVAGEGLFPLHQMILKFPLHYLMDMKENLVDWASRAGVQWLSTIIPTHHVNALIFFFILSNLTIDFFAFIIPLLIFYLSFFSMVICTLRVFQHSKAWENFRTLTSLLTRFEPSIDLEQAETNFGWNNLEPYLYFILSVFFVIFSFPVADKSWIPCSELATVAMVFTVASYMSLGQSAEVYTRRALITEVASSVCAMSVRLPEGMATARVLGQTFLTVPLGAFVVLKLSIPCILYIYLFYMFFRMAQLRSFRGTYCFLVPYMVCFMWCEFSVVLLQSATAVGLIRTCVAYFLFLFALPALMLGLAAMLLVQMVRWLVELQVTKMLVTLAVCAVPVMLRLWTRFSLSLLDVFHAVCRRNLVKLILVWISAVVLLTCVYVYSSEGLKVYNSTLTWQKYSSMCGPPAWLQSNMAQTQMGCSHLEGHRVTWRGLVKHVRVVETENGAQAVINLLPTFVGDWLRCLYGEVYPQCEGHRVTDSPFQSDEDILCQLKPLAKHECHVKRFDSYRFEVIMGNQQADPSADIILRAGHEFKSVLLNMPLGSMAEFSTKLAGQLGSKLPVFDLRSIHCLDCQAASMPVAKQYKIEPDWRGKAMCAMKFAFDFFFSPFLSAHINK